MGNLSSRSSAAFAVAVPQPCIRNTGVGPIKHLKMVLLAGAGVIAILSEIGQRGGPCEASAGLCSTTASNHCGVYLDRMLHWRQYRGHLGE